MARKTKADALKTRQHLIDTAIVQFAARGVSNTTLNDIADAASVTRGALYWHFENKTQLFNELWLQQPPLRDLIQDQHYLDTGELLPPLPLAEVKRLLCAHIRELHDFYGQAKGYRIARKHVSWYLQEHAPDDQFRRTFNAIEDSSEQLAALEAYFENFA